MEKGKIQFKPLHEGMGFHPFSDGLPYAPESKSKYSTGSGATAAGRPQFASPNMAGPAIAPATSAAPKVTARQLQEQRNAAGPATITQHEPLGRTQHIPMQTKAPEKAKAPQIEIPPTVTTEQAILRRRVFAYVMDTIIHAGFWLAVNLSALFIFRFQIDGDIVKENWDQFAAFFLISQWLFIALQEILFENSIGKAFFNLEFKRNHRSLFLRSMIFMIGVMCAGLGLYFRPQDKLGEIQLKSKLYA